MTRVLVTGASGLLGSNLVLSARPGDELLAVYATHPIIRQGVRCVQSDLAVPGEARRLLSHEMPDWVVHCAAATDIDACERQPAWAMRLNRDMAGYVAEAASEVGAQMVHVSTDAVFGSLDAPHDEDEPPSPPNVYGRTKLAGEQAVLEAHPDAAVIRTNLFGWNAQPKLGLAEWFLDRLSRKMPCPGFTDVEFSPILVTDLAGWFWRILQLGLGGVWHVGGSTCLSKYAFGVRIAEAFGYDPGLVARSSLGQAELAAPRSNRLCLNSTRIAAALGELLPTVEDGLEHLKQQATNGHRQALKAMVLQPEERR